MSDSKPPNSPSHHLGRVYLVGAGPGAPGLITVRGVECLQRADVVLYDFLVNPVLTQYAPKDAELICVGKHGGGARIWKQEEINRELVKFATAGKTVVRLKGGDPAVFARGGEEIACLAEHGIPLEIVPGITTALAAGSHAGISITHRDLASAVALVTGRERPGKSASDLDFAALARFPGTLVFYMGVTTVAQWTGGLLSNGMPGETPVALIRRCSHTDQETLRCRLDEVESRLTPRTKFPPPVIAIVGAVAGEQHIAAGAQNWFEQRPLFGQSILVTRPAGQAAELAQQLEEQGAQVVCQPAIEIRPVEQGSDEHRRVVETIAGLASYDWIVFSSSNGVEQFMHHLRDGEFDIRALGAAKIASVGSATSSALHKLHVVADLQPAKFDADALAAELVATFAAATPPRILSIRADRGRDILKQSLTAAGAEVDEVAFYHNADVTELSGGPGSDGKLDWITVTSSAIAASLLNLLGKERLSQSKLASISPITSNALRELGLEPAVEAESSTMSALVAVIIEHVEQHPSN